VHTRSRSTVGATDSYSSGVHVVWAVQPVSDDTVQGALTNWPAAQLLHALHTVSSTGVQGADWKVLPATQLEHAAHCVSWSSEHSASA
jgi:hypothetical protein